MIIFFLTASITILIFLGFLQEIAIKIIKEKADESPYKHEVIRYKICKFTHIKNQAKMPKVNTRIQRRRAYIQDRIKSRGSSVDNEVRRIARELFISERTVYRDLQY